MLTTPVTVFDFDVNTDLSNWYVLDDVVMGGRSDGKMLLSDEGHGIFTGAVSLENNGGFSSVRLNLETLDASKHDKIVLRIKGDGKSYQLRVKPRREMAFSYVHAFDTQDGEWAEIELTMADFFPTFRGQRLNMENFDGSQIEELGILIGNKKAEDFRLLIDWIQLQ